MKRTSAWTPERVGTIGVGLAAAVSSTLLVAWAPVSDLGRAIVFLGSFLSGAGLASWSSKAASGAGAFGKSIISGAIQANVSATLLVFIAVGVDTILGITPDRYPRDLGGLALIIAVAGSVVGAIIGMFYSFVPIVVAISRRHRTHASTDRVMLACGGWLAAVAAIHSVFLPADASRSWAWAWQPLVIVACILLVVALARIQHRAYFLDRVREGHEPRYRIVPIEAVDPASLTSDLLPIESGVPREACTSALVRIAERDDEVRDFSYRENARTRDEDEPEPIALVG